MSLLIKVGSAAFEMLERQGTLLRFVQDLLLSGNRLVLVISGAILLGKRRLGDCSDRTAAAVGQPLLYEAYTARQCRTLTCKGIKMLL